MSLVSLLFLLALQQSNEEEVEALLAETPVQLSRRQVHQVHRGTEEIAMQNKNTDC